MDSSTAFLWQLWKVYEPALVFFFYNCFLSYKTQTESHDFHSFLCHIIINQVCKGPNIKKTVERGHLCMNYSMRNYL